jgi:hypothetical protein
MFELSWVSLQSLLASALRTNDSRIVPVSLNGIKYALMIALSLDIPLSREAFITVLAEFTYKQLECEGNVDENLASNKHLLQQWYIDLKRMVDIGNSSNSIKMIRKCIEDAKVLFIQEVNCRKLDEIQNTLPNDVNIIHSNRTFIGQGDLFRITGKTSKKLIHMFLLSDSLIFCTGEAKQGYKVNRVLQLATCKVSALEASTLEEFNISYGFEVQSSQKTILCSTEMKGDMEEWIKEISGAISRVKKLHKKLISMSSRLAKFGMISPEMCKKIEFTGFFVGKSTDMLIPQSDLEIYNDRCKLCFQNFNLFTRPQICNFCEDPVCSDCNTKKVGLPSQKRKVAVCDVCFGIMEQTAPMQRKASFSFSKSEAVQ